MEMFVEKASNWDEKHISFERPSDFEKYLWETMTGGKCYKSFKIFMETLIFLINKDYKKCLKNVMMYNVYLFKVIYDMMKSSTDSLDLMSKMALTTTLNHAYQVSNITGVGLDETIRRLRIGRNIPIVDKKTKEKKISRQVRYPLVGSEVCPFTNYVKVFEIKPKLKFNYSIIVIEKPLALEVKEYECEKHESCVMFKDMEGNIKHLDECEFWTDDQYWIRMYPHEVELVE